MSTIVSGNIVAEAQVANATTVDEVKAIAWS